MIAADYLFTEMKSRLESIKFKIDIGVPFKKLETERRQLKREFIVKWIQLNRSKGATYQQMADVLNMNQVPTLSGGNKWLPRTIHGIENGK